MSSELYHLYMVKYLNFRHLKILISLSAPESYSCLNLFAQIFESYSIFHLTWFLQSHMSEIIWDLLFLRPGSFQLA